MTHSQSCFSTSPLTASCDWNFSIKSPRTASKAVAPILHCIRHAQGFHNLALANHTMHDPSLTPLGESQSRKLSQTFPHHDSITLLVSSPLRRCLYTTLLGFESETHKGLNIIAIPELQETSNVPCDTGSDPEKLREEFKDKPVDLSLLHVGWNNNDGIWAPDVEAIDTRARAARQWLKARPEKEIVVMTHGGFLHYFTEDWQGAGSGLGTGWSNTEFRSFEFGGEEDDSNASLVETDASRARRRVTGKLLSGTQQLRLRETAMRMWEDAGLQPAGKA